MIIVEESVLAMKMLGNVLAVERGYRFHMITMVKEEMKRISTSLFSKEGYSWVMDPGAIVEG